jgi:hypothetical protein
MQAWCRTSILGGDRRRSGVPQGVASVPAALAAKQLSFLIWNEKWKPILSKLLFNEACKSKEEK